MARGAEELAADDAAVVARLSAALENPALSDLVLRSERDGSETRAAAILLASCSPVFTKMLTGAFAEGADRGRKRRRDDTSAAAPPVRCEFSGEALGAIVAFAATNDAPVLWSGSAKVLSEILEASEYYDIDGLRRKAKRQLIARAREVPVEVCEVLQAVWERWATDEFGDGSAGEVAKAALAVIEGSEDVSLMDFGCLCEEAMEKVLGGKSTDGEEGKFTALQKWLPVDEEIRKTTGRRLVSCLSLELMSPTFIAGVVAKSGLVSNEVLLHVSLTFAVRAQLDHGLFSQACATSALPNWCCSGSDQLTCTGRGFYLNDVVGFLDRSLDSGCWTWEIRAEKSSGSHSFGVGSVTGEVESNNWLGDHIYGFVCAQTGVCSSGGKLVSRGPSYGEGDTIRLTLDCETGTLTTKVNGGTPHEAFTGIVQVGNRKYFRPAVSLMAGACARILSFNSVEGPV